MRRFTYAPDINVYIATQDHGFIDVSDDVIRGTVTRRVNAMSDASVELQNPNRKYLRKIKPMDRIVIYLTRIHQPVLVFSGYVDRAPFDQLYPAPVTISASCTLKRLMHTYWDPALPYVMKWLAQYGWIYNNQSGTMIDPGHNLYNSDFSGGLGHLLRAVMNDVGGWPIGIKGQTKNTVHVMKLPDAFLKKTKSLLNHELQSIERNQENIDRILQSLLTADGIVSAADNTGTSSDSITMTDSVRDSDPLPLDTAKKYWNATIYGERVYLRDNPQSRGDIVTSINAAFEAKGIPGFLGVAVSMLESNLNPTAANSYGYMGLFQTKSDGAGGVINNGAHKALLSTAEGTIRSTGSGYTFDDSIYPSGMQISDAADWFAAGFQSQGISNPRILADADLAHAAMIIQLGSASNETGSNAGYSGTLLGKFNSARSEIAKAPQNISGSNRKPTGTIGDCKTSNARFFHGGGQGQASSNERTGYTFKIRGNPFGNDDLLFRALYDSDVPSDSLAIYVPGATGKGTPWAQNWRNKKIALETSFGNAPFTGQQTGTNSGNTSLTGKVDSDGVLLPTQQTPTHETSNLPGFPAVDIMESPGTPVGAPENGRLSRISGHPPSQPPPEGQGGPWGLSFYYIGSETGNIYFGTHLQQVAPVGTYRRGDVVGIVGDYPGSSADHIHWGINSSPGSEAAAIANSPSTMSGDGSIANSNVPLTSTGVLGSTGVHANQQNMTAVASAVAFGIELGFPTVGDTTEALLLTGTRALANDVPLFNWVEFICKASGRNFQSMPNGDFLAFYPDHFNWSGTAPYFRISPIETIDLTIDIGDEELTTHVFTTGDTYYDGLSFLDRVASTVASVESADFRELVGVGKTFNAFNFLKRYGARPWQEDRPELKNSFMQFMYGWMTFLDKWAKQFYCDASFTFLPELFPGGIVDFPPPHNLKMYVEEVTHTFDREAGFSTTASLTSPSHYGGSSINTAMVLADGGLKGTIDNTVPTLNL